MFICDSLLLDGQNPGPSGINPSSNGRSQLLINLSTSAGFCPSTVDMLFYFSFSSGYKRLLQRYNEMWLGWMRIIVATCDRHRKLRKPKPHGRNSWNSETKKFCCVGMIWCVLPDPSSEKPQLLLCLAVMNMLLLGSLMTRSSLYLQFQRPWSSWRTWKSNPAPTRNHSLPSEWKGQIEVEYISS